jgi:hypothetical protein
MCELDWVQVPLDAEKLQDFVNPVISFWVLRYFN